MNIAHIVDVNHLGNGITAVVHELSHAQKAMGNNVLVLNIHEKAEDIEGFVRCTDSDRFPAYIEEFKPDIVVFHGVFYVKIKSMAKEIVRRGIPYLVELHGAYSRENYKKNKLKKWLFRHVFFDYVLNRSQGLIFLNDSERNNFAINTGSMPTYILPNGCRENNDSRLGELDDSGVINFLYLSRIDLNHKGLDILVDAIKLLVSRGALDKVKFSFYGPGHDDDVKQFKASITGLDSYVKFHGPVYKDQKAKVLGQSDIFILTSRYEGFPMSILEALSYGCPCLVSKGTNVADIIIGHDAGWVVKDLCVQNVADTIIRSVADYRSRAETLRANAMTASREYNWDRIASKSIEIYNIILKNYNYAKA